MEDQHPIIATNTGSCRNLGALEPPDLCLHFSHCLHREQRQAKPEAMDTLIWRLACIIWALTGSLRGPLRLPLNPVPLRPSVCTIFETPPREEGENHILPVPCVRATTGHSLVCLPNDAVLLKKTVIIFYSQDLAQSMRSVLNPLYAMGTHKQEADAASPQDQK